jgi:hypothetical protein
MQLIFGWSFKHAGGLAVGKLIDLWICISKLSSTQLKMKFGVITAVTYEHVILI